jgi:hypothetical protein
MRYAFYIFIFMVGLSSCMKREDVPASAYEGQDSLYCNDPEAINYNREFPGTPDNATCLYPTDVFAGRFLLTDTVYTEDFASNYIKTDTINIYQLSKTKIAVVGFCGAFDSLKLTAGRYYKATLDSTIENGQPLCNPKDTVSGLFSSGAMGIRIDMLLTSDTAGTKFHRGTAILIN